MDLLPPLRELGHRARSPNGDERNESGGPRRAASRGAPAAASCVATVHPDRLRVGQGGASRSTHRDAAALQRITATGGGVPVRAGRARVASSSVRSTPACVRPRLRQVLSRGQPAPQALSTRTRCTSLPHSSRPRRRQATFLENDHGSSHQVPALHVPTGSPTSVR
jgi:hypothetical protein